MASIIRSVSLTPKTAQIASRMGNFSAFVRECLERYDAARGGGEHSTDEEHRVAGLCNGMREPPCVLCFPLGAPPRNAWRTFTSAQSPYAGQGRDEAVARATFDAAWLLEQCAAKARQEGDRWDFITESVAYRPPEPEPPQIGRARAWLRKWF